MNTPDLLVTRRRAHSVRHRLFECDRSTPKTIVSLIGIFAGSLVPLKAAPQKAIPADAFVDSIGVVVHPDYISNRYGVVSTVTHRKVWEDKLVELGVRHIRTHWLTEPSLAKEAQDASLNYLATIGIKFNLLFDPKYTGDANWSTNTNVDPAPLISSLAAATVIKGATATIEGANEYDIRQNPVPANWSLSYINWQNRLYSQVNTPGSGLNGIPIVGGSIVKFEAARDNYAEVSPHSYLFSRVRDAMDFATAHPYPGGANLPESKLLGKVAQGSGALIDKISGPDIPLIMTESGYDNAIYLNDGNIPISYTAGGKYLPRLLFDFFTINRWHTAEFPQGGVTRTFLYELMDEISNPDLDDDEAHFGLVKWSATPASVSSDNKPAYIAIQNIINLLQEKGVSFVPGELDYSLDNGSGGAVPSDLRHLLLQRSGGAFFLVLWRNQNCYTPKTWEAGEGKDIVNPPATVRVRLAEPALFSSSAVQHHSFAIGAGSQANITISPAGYVSLPNGVGDEVTILRLQPARSKPNFPDLVVEDISWASNPQPGQSVTFTATVKNQGGVATPAGQAIGVKFIVDGITSPKTWGSIVPLGNGLAPGASVAISATGGTSGATWSATFGEHAVSATVDDTFTMAEVDDTNNVREEKFTVGPDLVVDSIGWTPRYPMAGQSVQFTAKIRNAGSQNSSRNFTVSFSGVPGSGSPVTATATSTGSGVLAPGETVVLTSASVALPAELFVFTAEVDSANTIDETNENNNVQVFGVESGPDLVATNLSWDLVGGGDPGNVLQGSQLIFKATLKNQGNSYSNKLRTVGFQVNSVTETWKNTGASAMQPFTFVTDVASNGPNGRIYWTVPNSPHVNEYVARVVIDGSANSIPESDETNNDLLTVKLLPNLDITDVSFDGGLPLTMASTDKFTAKVVNAGRIATLGGVNAFRVKFFVDDQAIGASNWHTVAVPPGGSVSLKSPNWTPASTGHHKFRAEIELGTHGGLALLDANLLDNVFNRGNVNGVQDGLWVHP